ncbi:MAG: hypothetical protein BWK80_01100, partial [Desulfobacteraceae bacterium IS3]
EPTNHLDMESCDALLAAIDNFDGVVVMVTHNEMFLHALAERLIVFQNEGIEVFDGTYGEFLEKGGWNDETLKETKSAPEKSEEKRNNVSNSETLKHPAEPKLTKKEIRRRRSEIISERSKLLKPAEQKISRTEDDIDRHEKEMEALNKAMQAASQARDGAKIREISQAIHICQTAIEQLFEELELLTKTYDEKNAVFEKRLGELEQLESESR